MGKWYSACNPSRDESVGSNPATVQKNKTKKKTTKKKQKKTTKNRETPGSHDLGVARPT